MATTTKYTDKLNAEYKAKFQDFLYAKSREIIREKGGLITTEDAYNLAVKRHVPKLIKEASDRAFREGKFELWHLYQRLFFTKSASIRAAAIEELKAKQKEIDDKINWAADPYSP